jgi:molybdenum cofactor cytidylyltransferase
MDEPRAGAQRVATVLLAAGASSRLGTPKQLLRDAHDTPLLARLIQEATLAGCDPVIVVLGAESDAVRASLGTTNAHLVHNPEWPLGMATSIRVGVDAALAANADAPITSEVDALLLMACDQPAVARAHLEALLAAHAAHGGRVVSSYDGAHGIPAVWPRADWPALRQLSGDRGAKALLRGDEAAVPLAGGALDLDTPDDVQRWRAESG